MSLEVSTYLPVRCVSLEGLTGHLLIHSLTLHEFCRSMDSGSPCLYMIWKTLCIFLLFADLMYFLVFKYKSICNDFLSHCNFWNPDDQDCWSFLPVHHCQQQWPMNCGYFAIFERWWLLLMPKFAVVAISVVGLFWLVGCISTSLLWLYKRKHDENDVYSKMIWWGKYLFFFRCCQALAGNHKSKPFFVVAIMFRRGALKLTDFLLPIVKVLLWLLSRLTGWLAG